MPENDSLWSSSEYSNDNSWKLNTNNGNMNNNNKGNDLLVRAFLYLSKINTMITDQEIIDNPKSIPLEDFYKAYFDCRKHKRRTCNALLFELDYEHNLYNLWREVNTGTYEIGRSIAFLVYRPKLREVFAADFRDRIVHRLIMQRLEPLFEDYFIDSNYNCRKRKGTLYGVFDLQKQIAEITKNYVEPVWIGKFDMQSFFTSINKDILVKDLVAFVNEKYDGLDIELLISLITLVIRNCPQVNCIRKSPEKEWEKLEPKKSLFHCPSNIGLPIGNLTSQCFANFYLAKFDHLMYLLFDGYGRYVDDYFVISKDKKHIIDNIPFMRDYLWDELKIRLHPKKIAVQPSYYGIKFIGGVVKNERTYIANSVVSNAYEKLFTINKTLDANKLVTSLNSYWGFLKYHRTFNIKNKLIDKLDSAFFEYVTYNGRRFKLKNTYNHRKQLVKTFSKFTRTKRIKKTRRGRI